MLSVDNQTMSTSTIKRTVQHSEDHLKFHDDLYMLSTKESLMEITGISIKQKSETLFQTLLTRTSVV